MRFEDFLFESMQDAHAAVTRAGIKLKKDHETGEHSATVHKNYDGHLKVSRLHHHLKDAGWKHSEHKSGHVFKHPKSSHTVTIYHKGAGADGHEHHEIVLGKH